jgi:2,3-diketo-5-methylthio-1-phosphopentane phosphatase/methylthioribulose-1-phosphate dehydratase
MVASLSELMTRPSPRAAELTWVILDIEGTTSPTAAIKTGLYEYARPRLGAWIDAHAGDPEVGAAVAQVRGAAGTEDVVALLHRWMDEDVKATPLKTLQGQIWAAGFAAGDLAADFFPDVAPALRSWTAAGLRLAVFSSGSVASQQSWFAHAADGDLSALVTAWFDTANAGPKQDPASYRRIAASLREAPARILFLSDTRAELTAAAAAGWRTVQLARPGEPGHNELGHAEPGHADDAEVVATFADVVLPAPIPPARVAAAGARIAVESARLAALGWMRGTSGNLSEVLSREPLRVAVSASGVDKGLLTAADVTVVDAAGRPVPAPGAGSRKPSAEAVLHVRIAGRTGAGAVVHVHSHSAVRAAARWPDGIVLRDLEMLKGLGRGAQDDEVRIPVIANSQDMTELADRFDRAREPRTPVIVVAGHGMYAWGADLGAARHITECADWLLAYALG